MSDQSSPSSDSSDRRQKVVMALGIATIVLFSANLLTVLAHHFWPDQHWRLPFLTEQESTVETAGVFQFDIHAAPHVRHHIVIHRPDAAPEVIVDGSLHAVETDLAEMERQAQRMKRELERELASIRVEGVQWEARQRVAEVHAALESAAGSASQASAPSTFRVHITKPDNTQD